MTRTAPLRTRIASTLAALSLGLLAFAAFAGDAAAKEVKHVTEEQLEEACDAVGGTFEEDTGTYVCTRPDDSYIVCQLGQCFSEGGASAPARRVTPRASLPGQAR